MRNHFLICGNGQDINELDLNRLNKKIITAGVNRIYLKFIPMYYYIYDLIDILPHVSIVSSGICNTIYTHNSKLSEYFREHVNNMFSFYSFPVKEYTTEFTIKDKKYTCNHSSVNMLIRILNDYLFKDHYNYFYICGVPLLESEGHFYDESINSTSQKILDKIYNDFIRLKHNRYRIISCMEKSKLNELFPVEKKDILYEGSNAI